MTLGPQFDPQRFGENLRKHLEDTGLAIEHGKLIAGGKVFPAIGHHFLERHWTDRPDLDDQEINMEIPHESGLLTGIGVSRKHDGHKLVIASRWGMGEPKGLFVNRNYEGPDDLAKALSEHLREVSTHTMRSGVHPDDRQLGEHEMKAHREGKHRNEETPITGSWLSNLAGRRLGNTERMYTGSFDRNFVFRGSQWM